MLAHMFAVPCFTADPAIALVYPHAPQDWSIMYLAMCYETTGASIGGRLQIVKDGACTLGEPGTAGGGAAGVRAHMYADAWAGTLSHGKQSQPQAAGSWPAWRPLACALQAAHTPALAACLPAGYLASPGFARVVLADLQRTAQLERAPVVDGLYQVRRLPGGPVCFIGRCGACVAASCRLPNSPAMSDGCTPALAGAST